MIFRRSVKTRRLLRFFRRLPGKIILIFMVINQLFVVRIVVEFFLSTIWSYINTEGTTLRNILKIKKKFNTNKTKNLVPD